MKTLSGHVHQRFIRTAVGSLAFTLASVWTLRAQSRLESAAANLTQYQIGNPSGDETAILEIVNRTRANPSAEGQRLAAAIDPAFYGDLQDEYQAVRNEILTSFSAYPARPPLAFNASLNAAAQFHLQENIAAGMDAHNSPDGTTPQQRVRNFGYQTESGENCAGLPNYPLVYTPWNVEASYECDTGEPGYGHRINIMEPDGAFSVEVGIANQAMGGWNVQDFGGNSTVPLLAGVVYTDNAATGFYVSGEGVGGVTVTAPGASSFYAVTTASGAYTLPLDLLPAYDAAAPLASATIQMDYQGSDKVQTVPLTHTVASNGMTYYDANSQVRYDNAKADWLFPATAAGVSPTPTPTPTPAPPPVANPSVSINPASDGTGFVVTRTGDISGELVVHYIVKGSAVAGNDYQPLSGTKKMKVSRASMAIKVKSTANSQGTVKLKLVDGSGYTVATPAQAKLRLGPSQ